MVDGTLLPCLNWRKRRDPWSVKHGCAGMNTLSLVWLNGGFMWASDPYPGSMHDVAVLDASGLLEGMDPSGWIGDKGYVGRGMIMPHKKPPQRRTRREGQQERQQDPPSRKSAPSPTSNPGESHTAYRRPLETFEQTITAALALYSFKTTP